MYRQCESGRFILLVQVRIYLSDRLLSSSQRHTTTTASRLWIAVPDNTESVDKRASFGAEVQRAL